MAGVPHDEAVAEGMRIAAGDLVLTPHVAAGAERVPGSGQDCDACRGIVLEVDQGRAQLVESRWV